MVSYLPLISSLVALIAGTLMLNIYRRRGEIVFLVPMASMYLFFFGAFLEFLSSTLGYWPEILYRLYYGTAPVQPGLLGAAILGIYTLEEFAKHRKIYRWYTGYVALLGILVFILSLVSEVDTELLSDPYVGGAAMAPYVRILSPPLTIPSSVVMIGYPLYTFIRGIRSLDKILFPIAAIVVAIGGFMVRIGLVTIFYSLELIGALLLLYAFYLVYRRYSE